MDRDPDECPISRAQAQIVWAQLGPSLRYLMKLRTRMERTRFPPKGRIYLACCAAYDAVHALSIHMHYAGCGMTGGPGGPPPTARAEAEEASSKTAEQYKAEFAAKMKESAKHWPKKKAKKKPR